MIQLTTAWKRRRALRALQKSGLDASAALLRQALESVLSSRVLPERPLILTLAKEPYFVIPRPTRFGRAATRDLGLPTESPVMPLVVAITRTLAVCRGNSADRAAATLLPMAVIQAACAADLLIRQLNRSTRQRSGHGQADDRPATCLGQAAGEPSGAAGEIDASSVLRWDALEPDWRARLCALLSEANQLFSLDQQLARQLRRVVVAAADHSGEHPQALVFSRSAAPPSEALQVSAMRADGSQIWTMDGGTFMDQVLGDASSPPGSDSPKMPDGDQIFEAGRSLLRSISPSLDRAVELAATSMQTASVHICDCQIRQHPAQILIQVNAMPSASADLVVRRAHAEFVLGNASGERFYFPPAQLCARIRINARDEWEPCLPTVRQSKGGLPWIHPYTGEMLGNPLGSMVECVPAPASLDLPISPEARRFLPGVLPGLPYPAEKDLCLNGQVETIRQLKARIDAAHRAGREPDVLGSICVLLDLVRVGLTRAHEYNTGTPRARLDTTQMLYPIPYGVELSGPLSQRVFPFAPLGYPPMGRPASVRAAPSRGGP